MQTSASVWGIVPAIRVYAFRNATETGSVSETVAQLMDVAFQGVIEMIF